MVIDPVLDFFWPKSQIQILSRFLEFGISDPLDNAYNDSTKWSERCGGHFRYVSMHNYLCIINLCEKRAKMRFFDHLIEFDGVDRSDTASSDG